MKKKNGRADLEGIFLLGLAVCLGLVFLAFAGSAVLCFDTALQAKELWPWLVSEAEPGADGAMYTLEERQFRWALAGTLYLVLGLCALAGGVWLGRKGWKRRREGKI